MDMFAPLNQHLMRIPICNAKMEVTFKSNLNDASILGFISYFYCSSNVFIVTT